MSFNPKSEYLITEQLYSIRDFHEYKDEFITRPPYQRKNVWSNKKKQSLLDSLFRRYYIPKIIIREVRLNNERTVNEVIDGQQRINTIQGFFDNKIKLPKTLEDVHPSLPNKYFRDLDSEFKRFINRELKFNADIVKGIDDPKNPGHQKIATEIFWRLQQGESLNFMEIAHARLASLSRNFVVKYADDITFDFEKYVPVEHNPNKHKFFKIIKTDNNRMQHLLFLTRFLIIEEADDYAELKDASVTDFIDKYTQEDGVGNYTFEEKDFAKRTLSTLHLFYEIFKDDPIIDKENGIKELSREYVILSFYILLRHLKKFYVVKDSTKKLFHDFLIEEFYPKWKDLDQEDNDIVFFSSNRQQDINSLQIRDQILRQMFFEFAKKNNINLIFKDENRAFNEVEKIKIYRRDKGLCQMCLKEGKSDKESSVSWKDYEADHIFPYAKGGQTVVENAQVLCKRHNRIKKDSDI